MPNYTLVLDEITAERIRNLNSVFGGSVGSFAATHIRDLAALTPEQIARVRANVHTLAQRADAERRAQPTPAR